MRLSTPHLLGIDGLEPAEISLILDTAESFAEIGTRQIKKVPTLRGKTVVNFFVEPSTRTRSRVFATRMTTWTRPTWRLSRTI